MLHMVLTLNIVIIFSFKLKIGSCLVRNFNGWILKKLTTSTIYGTIFLHLYK